MGEKGQEEEEEEEREAAAGLWARGPPRKGSGLVVFYYNRTVGVRRGWGAPCGMGLGEGSASPAVCR